MKEVYYYYGGDYPLFATIMVEYANKKIRGALIVAVFATEGFGILGGGIVGIIVSSAFQHKYRALGYELDKIPSLPPQADYVWRIIFIFGTFPAAMTYYWRMKMPETARYTTPVAKNAMQAESSKSISYLKKERSKRPPPHQATTMTYSPKHSCAATDSTCSVPPPLRVSLSRS